MYTVHSSPCVDVWEMNDYDNTKRKIRIACHEEDLHHNCKANILAINKKVIVLLRTSSL
jgi:hypothetical protein